MTFFELGIPTRILIKSKQDAVKLINRCNSTKNIYRSVYDYERLRFNDYGKEEIDPESVILDKVFFDFDPDESDVQHAFDDTKKLHEYLVKEDIKHTLRMSGGGYHVFVYTKNYEGLKDAKTALFNMHEHFCKKLTLNIDFHVKGDIVRLARVADTYNLKRRRYCINIYKEDLERGHEFIVDKAKQQNGMARFYGRRLLDVKEFDNGKITDYKIIPIEEDVKLEINKNTFLQEVTPCVSVALAKGNPGWRERFYIITYLMNTGRMRSEIIKILSEYLTKKKLDHVLKSEHQIEYLMKKGLMFPTCQVIKREGFCPIQGICKQVKGMYR